MVLFAYVVVFFGSYEGSRDSAGSGIYESILPEDVAGPDPIPLGFAKV